MSEVRCIAWTPNKRGQRCGAEVDDGELIMCAKHARRERQRRHMTERIEYGGHTIAREWRTNGGDLRDDWYFYVAEHMQIDAPAHSVLERRLYAEVDACNAERYSRCNAPVTAAKRPHEDDIEWDRFSLSRLRDVDGVG